MDDSSTSAAEIADDLQLEKTLALIKPEAVKFASQIEEIILEKEFKILSKRTVRLSPEQAAELYIEHYGQPYFSNLVFHMANTPVVALCLMKTNAIIDWLRLIGPANVLEAQANWPDSIRAKYGVGNEEEGDYFNAVHGSQDQAASLREIQFFFPTITVGPILRDWQISEYLQGKVNPTLQEGLSELCKEKPVDPVVWLADWLLTHNPNSPEIIEPDASSSCVDLPSIPSEQSVES